MGNITYAIGDIHGRADLLDDLLNLIFQDARRHGDVKKTIVTLGDYVDRGPDSKGVLDILNDFWRGFEVFNLAGNHEAMLLAYLEEGDQELRRQWFENRGYDIFDESGDFLLFPQQALSKEFRSSLKEYLGHPNIRFLKKLRRYHLDEEQNILFVHAGIEPSKNLADQTDLDLLWIREPFLSHGGELPYMVVHGHTHCAGGQPEIHPHRINVDTRAARTGVLTAAVFDTDHRGEVRFLQTNRTCGGSWQPIPNRSARVA